MIPSDESTSGSNLGRTLRDWMPVGMLLISGLVWGMKLEARYDMQQDRYQQALVRVGALETRLAAGILPLAEARIQAMQKEIDALHEEVKRCVEGTRK